MLGHLASFCLLLGVALIVFAFIVKDFAIFLIGFALILAFGMLLEAHQVAVRRAKLRAQREVVK
jgi:multisubunit Na+/H+ antiporter MnhE subunit